MDSYSHRGIKVLKGYQEMNSSKEKQNKEGTSMCTLGNMLPWRRLI